MPNPSEVAMTMTRTEALALVADAHTGLKVVEALGLIQNTASAERAINAVNEAESIRVRR